MKFDQHFKKLLSTIVLLLAASGAQSAAAQAAADGSLLSSDKISQIAGECSTAIEAGTSIRCSTTSPRAGTMPRSARALTRRLSLVAPRPRWPALYRGHVRASTGGAAHTLATPATPCASES